MKLGIDFGTTNCTVGLIAPDGRRVLKGPIPSVGAYKNEKLVFGDDARTLLGSDDLAVHPVRDLKLALGVRDVRMGTRTFNATEFSSDLIRFLIDAIGIHGGEVEEAVMGSPVRMSRQHRRALREAASEAGVRRVRFVYEPTAALIGAERFETVGTQDHVLVVDWGGGTLDAAVVRHKDGVFRELALHGDRDKLGGTQIDEALTRGVLSAAPGIRKRIDSIPGGFERLKDEVEDLKKEILEDLYVDDQEERLHAPHWLGEPVRLSPAAVNKVMKEFAERAASEILENIRRGGVPAENITHVLFAGGVCQSEVVREATLERFPHVEVIPAPAPQELTGAGCAELTKRPFELQTASGFGVRQSDDSVCVILPQGLVAEEGAYRQADFWVTDARAPEAILDLGIVNGPGADKMSLEVDSSGFVALEQMCVPAGSVDRPGKEAIFERIKLVVGIEENLAVRVIACSSHAGKRVEQYVTGVPLAIRIQESP